MDPISALDLGVPPQRKPSRDSFDYRPKALEAWLENLPIANLGETSRSLYAALREVNQLKLRPGVRLKFLDMVAGKVDYTVDGLRKHYSPKEFPLPPKNRKVAELALALLRETAIGYNVIIQGALSGEAKIGKAVLALAIYRALRYTGRLLVEIYGLYELSPPGMWKTLNALYLAAEARKVERLAVNDPSLQGGKRGLIVDRYLQLLLLSAAGPYRMRHNEAADTYRILERWAPHSRLAPGSDPAAAEAAFKINLSEDRPPQPTAKLNGASGDVRMLVTGGLIEVIQHELGGHRPWWKFWRKPQPGTDPELLRRLVVALGVIPKRQYSRQPLASRAQIMVGLSHISRVLAEQQGAAVAKGVEDASSHFVSRELRTADSKGDDVWDLIYPAELLKQLSEESKKTPAVRNTQSVTETQNWRLLNISAGGFCLLSDPTQSARAQVGELIALRELSDEGSGWQVGVIRWMKHVPAEGLQLGVQVLAPNPIPVLTRVEQAEGGWGNPARSLMLPEILATDQPVTLVTPSLGYTAERKVLLKGFGGDTEVLLTRPLESTGVFSQFEFRSASEPDPEPSEFESVFTSI